jgi:alpha-1,2-glucosyltransferase
MLVRQDNVIWAFLCFLLALHQFEWFGSSVNFISRVSSVLKLMAKRLWIFFLVFIAFIVFVKVNGGVAIGDPESHKLGRIYTTQIYLCLLTLFVLLLPLHVANAKNIVLMLRRQPIWIFAGACAFPVFILTFWTDHGYNNFGGFIHNEVVFWLRASLLNKVLAYAGIIWCFYSLLVTKLAEKRFYWLYPLSAVAVVPHALIEQRYFMVPIVLFLALRKRDNDKLDYLLLSIYVVASWYLGTQILADTIFM